MLPWTRSGDASPHVNGAYANFLTATTEEEVAAIYPPQTRERLAAVRQRYDPENLFSGNHNIRLAEAVESQSARRC